MSNLSNRSHITNLYHQKLNWTNTWLVSMGYSLTLTFIENITRPVQHLPNYLLQTIYRHTRKIIGTEIISLLEFEYLLGNKIKELSNPVANIIASQELNQN